MLRFGWTGPRRTMVAVTAKHMWRMSKSWPSSSLFMGFSCCTEPASHRQATGTRMGIPRNHNKENHSHPMNMFPTDSLRLLHTDDELKPSPGWPDVTNRRHERDQHPSTPYLSPTDRVCDNLLSLLEQNSFGTCKSHQWVFLCAHKCVPTDAHVILRSSPKHPSVSAAILSLFSLCPLL